MAGHDSAGYHSEEQGVSLEGDTPPLQFTALAAAERASNFMGLGWI